MIKEYPYNEISKAINDWAKSELEKKSLVFNPEISAFMQLQNFLSKCIPAKPRKVSMSRSFKVPDGHMKGFINLKLTLIRGKDANPYLSRQLYDASFTDGLLDNFNCFHFHLGENKKGKFIEGTKYLALAIVNHNEVFFIEVKPHGNSTWNNKSVLEIVHNERPDLIRHFKVAKMKNTTPKISAETDIQSFRDAGLNVCVTLDDGTSYMPAKHGQVIMKDHHKKKNNKSSGMAVIHHTELQLIVLQIYNTINQFVKRFKLVNLCMITNLEIFDLKADENSRLIEFKLRIHYFKNFTFSEHVSKFSTS